MVRSKRHIFQLIAGGLNIIIASMECRIGCGACCIEASISGNIPGMPGGKPGGVRCVNLDENNICTIWGTPDYPDVCRNFMPSADFCGRSNDEAMRLIAVFDKETSPEESGIKV